MRKILLLALLLSPLAALAQITAPVIQLVGTPPSGSCTQNLPDQQVATTGVLYSCQSGTWGASGWAPSTSVMANRFAINGLTMFGDSITAGTGASSSAYAYSTLLQSAFGTPFTNYAVSGDQAADQVNNQIYPHLNPTRYTNVPATFMVGTNDVVFCGATAGCENNYFHTLLSGVAWATIPYEFKIQPQLGITSGNCTTTGTWTDTTYGNVSALSSVVSGSTLTCTSLTSGDQAVYANWFAEDGLTSTATFSIDGTVVDTWDAFGFNGQTISTHNGITQTAFGTRYALSGSGSHTYTVTVGTAASGNAFTVLWIGSPAPVVPVDLGGQTQNPPRMAVGGVIRQAADASSAATATFNALALSVPAQLYADGALAFAVNVRNYVDLDYATLDSDMSAATLPNGLVTPASTSSPYHPNGGLSNGVIVGGHRHLADAFLAAMPPPPPLGQLFPVKIANVALTSYSGTTTVGPTALYSPPTNGSFRMCGQATVSVVATAGTFTLVGQIVQNGGTVAPVLAAAVSATVLHDYAGGCIEFYTTAGQNIDYELQLNSVTGTPTFNYFVTLEQLQ